MDNVLYGYNAEERIVAVHQLNDQTIRLYKRIGGKVLHQDVEFFPFFFLSDDTLIKEFPKKVWLKELAGVNFYRYLAAFSRWSEMWEAVHFILRQYNKNRLPRISSYQELKEILVRPDAVRQFLLQSGITLFKGMSYEELIRLHIDIQVAPRHDKRRKKKAAGEQILTLSLASSNGSEFTFSTATHTELTMLKQCIKRINAIDPDVIEGYDLFGSILPALQRASERTRIPLAIGRDGSDMRAPAGHGAASTSDSEWFSYDIFGRHLVDLLMLAEAEMNIKRADQTLALTSVAKHFGLAVDIEKNIPSSMISEEWDRNPESVLQQSLRNVHIARDLYDRLSPPLFYLAQMCPFNYRMLNQLNAASRIESLMLREYVRQRYSIPKAKETAHFMAFPPVAYQAGVFSDVLYVELSGIVPSILFRRHIEPATDELHMFPLLLSQLFEIQRKTSGHAAGGVLPSKDLQGKLKAVNHLIDSFHPYLGSARGLFNDSIQAEIVMNDARKIFKEILTQFELFNASVIQFDGDGFYLLSPNNIIGETNQQSFIERISNTLPEGAILRINRQFKHMLSYRKNNYALMDQKDNVVIKGTSLLSRGMERFLRIFIQRCIECLLTNDFQRLHHAYATAFTQITQHQWTPGDFCRTDIARLDTETYQIEVNSRQIASSPAMEAALRASLFMKVNSKISYYITGNEAGVVLSRSSRLVEEWDPHRPDENTAYYLSRLHEAIGKFREFFEPAAFERLITLDEMFAFSDDDIHIVSRKLVPETTEMKSETEEYGIWLAEDE